MKNAGRYNGRVAEIGLIDAVLSDDQFDSLRGYVNNRYALSI